MRQRRRSRRGASPVGLLALVAPLALFALGGCASTGVAERYDDPFEKMNRGIFVFNDKLDIWAVEPASKVWGFVLPDAVQASIKNIFDNAWMPAVIGNHLLQLNPKDAFLADLPRLVVNTTVGLAGAFDVATPMGIDDVYADFGLTMARWGVKPGPFLVLPLLGPSSVRDGVGSVADGFSSPHTYFMPFWGSLLLRTYEMVNLRSIYTEEIAQSKAEAFDYYLFRRDAWVQNRRHRVQQTRGETTSAADIEELEALDDEADSLYYFDEGADEGADEETDESTDDAGGAEEKLDGVRRSDHEAAVGDG